MRDRGAGHQCLGWSTSGVDTGAAEELTLDDGNGHAGGREAGCEKRAGLAGTHDDGIESVVHSSTSDRTYRGPSLRQVSPKSEPGAQRGIRLASCENVFIAVNSHASLPSQRHRAQQPFSKGVLSAACRDFGGVPACCDPIRALAQLGGGRIQRMSHWTSPP